ncbi:MAG: pseudouridine synthase [Flavobacteriaceae bacterium]|nr:pseudouridine synthase [Flavobacteriaceae bacterium]
MFETTKIWHPLEVRDRNQIPVQFTYPFNYQPHPWVIQAAEEIKSYLNEQQDFDYAFGWDDQSVGKMFGILIVENAEGKIGYLAAFSGKIIEQNQLPGFVPPVFDILQPDGDFRNGENEINLINQKLAEIENSQAYLQLKNNLQKTLENNEKLFSELKENHRKARDIRQSERIKVASLPESEQKNILKSLENQSKRHHFEMKDFKRFMKENFSVLNNELKIFEDEIEELKNLRKLKSAELQQILHYSFQFLNAKAEVKGLQEIFKSYKLSPPAGAGECAAPRLLQYAYSHDYKPLAMGEFWYGKSPNSQIRTHLNFYPACKTKCLPILNFMMQGLDVASDPAEKSTQIHLEILYEDQWLLAVNKPAGVLSVPGKRISHCMQQRVIDYWQSPDALAVHRLDMATSGILLFAKNIEIYKLIQKQFTHRKIKKVYTAVLSREIESLSGKIELPIRVDLEHRPMQLVDYQHGKEAVTYYQVVENTNGFARVLFYPYTGRTHQLRVHAAHQLGLNAPIIGDDLYGKPADRMLLHAGELEFVHPVTLKTIKIISEATF